MKIKQANDHCLRAENLVIYNRIPNFELLKKELGGCLRLIADTSRLNNGTGTIYLFAHIDETKYTVNYTDFLKKIAKITKKPLIISFEENEERKTEEMVVTIYDDYIE